MITISTLQMRQGLGDILNRVALRQDEYLIERKGKPLAAMVPVEKMQAMRKAAALRLLAFLKRPHSSLSATEADSLANEAKHRTRKGR